MTVELDHVVVPVHDRNAAAKRLGELLGVRWNPHAGNGFAFVHVNDGVTLAFSETADAYPVHHVCFRVDPPTFEAIFARIRGAGLPYRSTPEGPNDLRVNTARGGSNIYWDESAGHRWEILTVSYARPK